MERHGGRRPGPPDRELADIEVGTVPRRRVTRRALGDPTIRLGILLLLPILTLAVLGPSVAPSDPLAVEGPGLQPPSWAHPFGTDRAGRDLLSRVITGARLSVGAAVVVSLLIVTIGTALGMISGYLGGWVESVSNAVFDIVLAFPGLLLALVVAALLEPGLVSLVGALAGVGWVAHARVVRGMVFLIKERPFVEAARALGCSRPRIIARHVLPNVIPTVLVLATLELGNVILAVAALSFLGLGPQPPTPEWGAMINEGRNFFFSAPHLMLFPGLAITITVLGCNLLGDGLRDVLDPKR